MIPVLITELSATGPRVRVNGCPVCRRPLTLDHCGVVAGDVLARVSLAQRLHLRSCTG